MQVERKRAKVKNVKEGTLSEVAANRIYLVEGVPRGVVSGRMTFLSALLAFVK